MKIGKFDIGSRWVYLSMAAIMTIGEYIKVVMWNETTWFDYVIVGYIFFLVVCWFILWQAKEV